MLTATGCAQSAPEQSQPTVRGAIFPHHNIVGEQIDAMYAEIANPETERVILISTNHFNKGYHYIQAIDRLESISIDTELIKKLEETNTVRANAPSLQGEHGLTVHTNRIKKHFPNASLVPLAIKWETPQKTLDKLIQSLQSENLENTVIIASIDFSHYVSEEGAMDNDTRTMEWLKGWENGTSNLTNLDQFWDLEESTQFDTDISTAIDSPETLYVLTNLIPTPEKVEIWKRTSSASMFGLNSPMQNTSHIFVKVWAH